MTCVPPCISLQGETVPYIICIDRSGDGDAEAAGTASGKGLAQRAFHIDEVRAPGAQLEVDAAYYLSQQVRSRRQCWVDEQGSNPAQPGLGSLQQVTGSQAELELRMAC